MYDFLDVTSDVINDLLTGASIETEDEFISINRKRNPEKWKTTLKLLKCFIQVNSVN